MRSSTLATLAAYILAITEPSAGWLKSHCGAQFSITLPSWWGISFYPARNYECRGDGKDGFEFDWQGSKAPLWVPSGWKWFGTYVLRPFLHHPLDILLTLRTQPRMEPGLRLERPCRLQVSDRVGPV